MINSIYIYYRMNNNNTIFVENIEIDKHKKYLEYRKEWVKK